MKQFLFLIIILFSTTLTGQDFTTNLQHPTDSRNYDFFTFPNPETNEVYAVALHISPVDNNTSRNILWKINTATNKTEQVSIPNYLLNDIRDVRDIFYYKDHIFCLKRITNNKTLMLQAIALKENATSKPQFISLSNGNEQYVASKFIEKNFYVFTASRKKRLLKIYKLDLNQEKVETMEVNMPHEDILTLRVNNFVDERYFTKIIDNKDFNHPNQLLVNNKIYIEKDKIVLLQQSLNDKQQSIIYQIDFDTKTFDRKEIRFSHSSNFFNSIYHNNYIYRFSGSNANMTVEAIGLIPENKPVRYVSNNDIKTLPFQTSSPKKISFNKGSKNPIITNYQSGKLFRKPFTGLNYRTLGLIEDHYDNPTIYVGYTPVTTETQSLYEPDLYINCISLLPHQMSYYFVETNLYPSSNATYDDTSFKVPNFAKVIAMCQSEGLRTRFFQPIEQHFLIKNEIAGVQVHRLADGFYGTYFNNKTNEFGFKKLVDLDLVE